MLNNVFSLVKNIFYKLKDPKKKLSIVLALAGAAVIVFTLIRTDLDARQKVLLVTGGILLASPLLSGYVTKNGKSETKSSNKTDTITFFTGTVLMALITGVLIPSAIISDSVLEFLEVYQLANPVKYVINALLLSLGSWVLWCGIFYFFTSNKLKALFSKGIWIICGISLVDYMFFGTKLGTISSTLQYDTPPSYRLPEYALNVFVLIIVAFIMLFIYVKIKIAPRYILIVGVFAVAVSGLLNTVSIMGTYSGYINYAHLSVEKPSIPLSKKGKNVIVLMLDRALGTEVPFIFNEKSELKEKFDGFTYYPNTISFGGCTLVGAPALFGGYEYTPEKMNERDAESLQSKHNESLKVMPVLF
jgi:hypothetical protein